MSKIKSFSVNNGDMFYIKHGSNNFTVIDCNLIDDIKDDILEEIKKESKDKSITRFISTHPDEDHIHGIECFDEECGIVNFYCVKNKATKSDITPSFSHYCKLRDDTNKAFYLEKDCSRKWMNRNGEDKNGVDNGSSGINILWPILDNDFFITELKNANDGGNANNISPIIKYSVENGVSVLWFGDLEHHFMESIENVISMPNADIVFAPHHGRLSGAIPEKWLSQINPSVIILGEAPSSELKYFSNYKQITQNTAKDITIICDNDKVHFYSSNKNYGLRDFLSNEYQTNSYGYYIGTLNL